MKLGKPGGGGALGVLKDKRVMFGAAAAGVLGLVVLLKRGGSAVDQPEGAVLSPSQLDSSGSDLYNALQEYSNGLADIRDLLEQRPSTGTGSDPLTGPQRASTKPGRGSGRTYPFVGIGAGSGGGGSRPPRQPGNGAR